MRKAFDWGVLLRIRWRRDDKESIVCYVLFMALFVADFSALALVFPVVLYCYALLAQPPARPFWQARRFCSHTSVRIPAHTCLPCVDVGSSSRF